MRLTLALLIAAAPLVALAAPPVAPPATDTLRTGPAVATTLQTLSGTYASAGPEDWGRGTFGRRTFTFDRGAWTLDFVLALDPGFTAPVFAFRTHGTYRVGAPSAAVPGAFEAVFGEDAKHVTLLTTDPGLAQAFGLSACGLTPGVEKDVSAQGCAAWRPVAVCAEDHDLLALSTTGALHFGVRPADNDLCTADKRPVALLPGVWRR